MTSAVFSSIAAATSAAPSPSLPSRAFSPASTSIVAASNGSASLPVHVHVAIIGTAGRKEDARRMSKALFDRMVDHAAHQQRVVWKLPNDRVVLVSGGSAWADHVAVRLFLNEALDPDGHPYAGLQLFLPCPFILTAATARALDNGSWQWQANPGRLLNSLHQAFSQTMQKEKEMKSASAASAAASASGISASQHQFQHQSQIPSLNDIAVAKSFGARLPFEGKGFHARNKLVASKVDRLIAYTWGEDTRQPKDGGTKHTWDLCTHLGKWRTHVPLTHLLNTQSQTGVRPQSAGMTTTQSDSERVSSATSTVERGMPYAMPSFAPSSISFRPSTASSPVSYSYHAQ